MILFHWKEFYFNPLSQRLRLPIVHIYRDSLFEIIFNESGAQWSRGRKEFFSHWQ